MNFPMLGIEKGGTYGAALTQKSGRADNASRGGLKTNSGSSPGAVHNTAAGKSRDGVRGRPRYASDAERQTARRVRRYAAGLNSQGKPYQRHPNFVGPNETPINQEDQRRARRQHILKRKLAHHHRLAKENRAQGLRVDGKPFRRHVGFHAWKNFRATLPAAPTMNWETIERL